MWPELKCIGIRRTRIVDLGYVKMSAYNFVRNERNFTKKICSTLKGSFSSSPLTCCRYLYWFQRYLRSNSKVVVNRTDFCTFSVLSNFKGRGGRCPKETRQLPKFRWATPPNFKTWSFFSACKNLGAQHPLGAEIWFSEKFDYDG